MEFSWRLLNCPGCNKVYNWHIDKLLDKFIATSGLGPQSLKCSSCGVVFSSGLLEWQQMTARGKFRYIYLSIMYSVFLGIGFFMAAGAIFGVIEKNTNLANLSISDFDLILFIFCSSPIIVIQILRVMISNSRLEFSQLEPMTVSFWNWQTNLQFYGMVLLLLNEVFTAIIYVVIL